MFIVPAPGLAIPDPELRDILPAEGRAVTPSEYWSRRLRDGEVAVVNTPAPAAVIPGERDDTPEAAPAATGAGE